VTQYMFYGLTGIIQLYLSRNSIDYAGLYMKKAVFLFSFLSISIMPLLASAQAEAGEAFPCYLQFAKGTCWEGFEVNLQIIDEVKDKVIHTIKLGKDEFSKQERFPCQPEQELRFKTSFSPAIWEKSAGQEYDAKRVVFVPSVSMAEGKKAWLLKRCFHHDFLQVPLPSGGNVGACPCEQ
jgi:hypothetical protein